MNKNAMLGALAVAMIGVIIFLLYSSGAIGNNHRNYSPYTQNDYMSQGQQMQQAMPTQQAQVQQPAQQAQVQQPQPIQQAQPQKQAAPKKPKSSPPPVAPAPALLQTQNMAQLITLLNQFGPPSGKDQTVGCYIEVVQNNGQAWVTLAQVNEDCVLTPYDNGGAEILSRKNGEPFFNLYGSGYSLLRLDHVVADINLYEPRSPGLWFGNQVINGSPKPNCYTADNGTANALKIIVCIH